MIYRSCVLLDPGIQPWVDLIGPRQSNVLRNHSYSLALHKVFLLMIQNLWDNMEAPSLNLLLLMSSLALDQCFFFQRSPHIFNSCLFPSEWFCSFSIFALWSCPCSWEPLQVPGQSAMQSLLSSVIVWESQSPSIGKCPWWNQRRGFVWRVCESPFEGWW